MCTNQVLPHATGPGATPPPLPGTNARSATGQARIPAPAPLVDGRLRLTVLVDGGVRSGLDVVRMLALGAKGVLLGRAWAYAIAAEGGPGVEKLLGLIEAEMRVAMALTGVNTVAEIDRSIIAAAGDAPYERRAVAERVRLRA